MDGLGRILTTWQLTIDILRRQLQCYQTALALTGILPRLTRLYSPWLIDRDISTVSETPVMSTNHPGCQLQRQLRPRPVGGRRNAEITIDHTRFDGQVRIRFTGLADISSRGSNDFLTGEPSHRTSDTNDIGEFVHARSGSEDSSATFIASLAVTDDSNPLEKGQGHSAESHISSVRSAQDCALNPRLPPPEDSQSF